MFKKFINVNLLILLISLSHQAFGADKTISCANDSCSTNFSPTTLLEKPAYTAIDIGPNTEHVVVSVPASQTPRSVRINVNNGASPKNLLLDLSSSKNTANAGNTIIIGDIFANLQVKLNGFNGVRGRDASELCAEKVKNGNYGNDAKTFFNQRRAADPGLNPNRCDRIDLSYLQTYNFTCDDPSYQELSGTNPVVDVKRIKFKSRCNGILVQDLCLRRKVNMGCLWRNHYYERVGCGKGCSYWAFRWGGRLHWNNGIYVEDWLNYHINVYGVSWVCYNIVGGRWDGSDLFYDWNGRPYVLPGVNVNYEPEPGSIWEVYYTQAYGRCDAWWTYIRTVYTNKTGYDEVGTDCNPRNPDNSFAGIPEDPNKLVPWAYTGMAQEPEFGLETLQCAVGECPVNSTLSDLDRNLDVINPEHGSSGTRQGNGIALIYDTQSILTEAVIGQAGAGGRADLDSPTSTKYCGKIRDAESDGINNEFARNPSVSFRRYTWKAIETGRGGDPGTPPPASTNTVDVYKKLDSSVRYMLNKELL